MTECDPVFGRQPEDLSKYKRKPNSCSTRNVEMLASSLVTDAAINALCGALNDGDRHELASALTAAAPHIVAEALRQAARQMGNALFDEFAYTVGAAEYAARTLNSMADELERDAP